MSGLLCALICVRDNKIIASACYVDFETSKHTVLSETIVEIDPTTSHERFIASNTSLETRFLRIVAELEEKANIRIKTIILAMPDSCFAVKRSNIKYQFPCETEVTRQVMLDLRTKTYEHLLKGEGSNVLADIDSNSIYKIDDRFVTHDIENLRCSKVECATLAAYILSETSARLNYVSKASGLSIVFTMPMSYAIAQTFASKLDYENSSLILDIGYNESSVCVINKSGIDKVLPIQIGYHAVVVSLAQNLGTDIRTAHKMLRLYAGGGEIFDYTDLENITIDRPKFKRTLSKSVASLFEIIKRNLSPKIAISQVIMYGDICQIPQIQDIAKDMFQTPVRIAALRDNLESDSRYDIVSGMVSKFAMHQKEIIQVKKYRQSLQNKIINWIVKFALNVEKIF